MKDYLFKQASFEGVSMSELGRRGALKRAKKKAEQRDRYKGYALCRKCGTPLSFGYCCNCD